MTRSRDTADQINRINSSAANATAITVDSSERVLIGTTTEGQGQADNFTVSDSGNMGMTLRSTDSSECSIFFSDATSGAGEYAGSLQYIHSNDSMRFATAGVARMTLDASGNLMTVKTAVDTDAVGSELRSNGLVSSTRTGAEALFLNRKSSNGSIAVFAKDGSTVGRIGTSSGGRLTVGSGSSAAGIRFDGAQWIPTISDAASDNGVDIGWSDSRIRNVYLSGGVYLGGTGAANKLDDAEYGVWNPANSQITLAASNGNYVKVGRMCTVTFRLVWPTNSNGVQARISLPFTCASHGSDAHMAGLAIAYTNYTASPAGGVYSNQAFMELFKGGSNALSNADLSGKQINGSVTYITNA